MLQQVLAVVQQIRQVLLRLGKNAECAVGMWKCRHDGEQAERGMQTTLLEPVPTHGSCHEIGPEGQILAHPGRFATQRILPIQPTRQPVEEQVDGNRRKNRQQEPLGRQFARRVEDRQDDQAAGVIGNCEKQQEADRRMPGPEHESAHKVAEGDVGGSRYRPAIRHRVIRIRAKIRREPEIHDDRTDHPSRGCDERSSRLSAAERAVLKYDCLPDLLRGDCEEEGHQHVIHEEVQAQDSLDVRHVTDAVVLAVGFQPIGCINTYPVVEPERILDQQLVRSGIGICPDKRDQRADDQQQRIVGDEVPDAIHPEAPSSTQAEINCQPVLGKSGVRNSVTPPRSAAFRSSLPEPPETWQAVRRGRPIGQFRRSGNRAPGKSRDQRPQECNPEIAGKDPWLDKRPDGNGGRNATHASCQHE